VLHKSGARSLPMSQMLARRLAEMLGQKTEAMAKHYSRRADMSKKMAETVSEFEAEMNRRKTKTSR